MNTGHSKYTNPSKHHAYLKPVGLFRRLAAFCYDLFLIFSLLIFSTFFLIAMNHGNAIAAGNDFYRAYLLSVIFMFYVGFWYWRGQTLGMLAWGIKLVDNQGRTPSFWRLAIRFVTALLTSIVGLLWSITNKKRLALYDIISGTRLASIKNN